MNIPERYAPLLSNLREIVGPIIRFRIDRELLGNSDPIFINRILWYRNTQNNFSKTLRQCGALCSP